MANRLYPKFKEALLKKQVDLIGDVIKVVLIDTADYSYVDTHEFLSSVDEAARVGTPQALGTKSVTGGVFDAADVTLPAVVGDQSEALLIYQDTGNPATSRLIGYFDQANGLPVAPSGADVPITWPNGSSRIFAL